MAFQRIAPPEVCTAAKYVQTIRPVLAVACLLFSVAALAAAVLLPVFRLPKLTGPHQVSYIEFELVDHSRPEWIEPWVFDKTKPRRLVARLTYPASLTGLERGSIQPAPYDRNAKIHGAAIAADRKLPSWAFDHFAHVKGNGWILKSSSPDADPLAHVLPVAEGLGRLPVLLYSHGYSGFYNQNTALLEDLASHGYASLAVSHTYDALATVLPVDQEVKAFNAVAPPSIKEVHELKLLRSQQLQCRVEDVQFAFEQVKLLAAGRLAGAGSPLNAVFAGRLDCERVGLLGHSFGGATAMVAGQAIKEVKGVVGLDAWTFTLPTELKASGLEKPVACIQADRFFIEHTPFGKGNRPDIQQIMSASKQGVFVEIKRAGHVEFIDVAFYAPILTALAKATGYMFQPVVHHILRQVVLDFFQAVLCGTPADVDALCKRADCSSLKYIPKGIATAESCDRLRAK